MQKNLLKVLNYIQIKIIQKQYKIMSKYDEHPDNNLQNIFKIKNKLLIDLNFLVENLLIFYQLLLEILFGLSMTNHLNIAPWPLIPQTAFLYFPQGNAIRQGHGQKQWRKIFQDGSPYDKFEEQNIQKLQKKLKEKAINPSPWFDKANKLRFLQANKYKIEETCKSIKEATTWRTTYFPLRSSLEAIQKLNEGTLYFCGRDREYRPILVVQIIKMKNYSQEVVPDILNCLLQFAIQNLLIQGQVENYVLIINLDGAGVSDRSSVSKIVSFTSNTYRSRLFASYLLNTPFLIASGWNTFASAIVSQNTLRKIKISKTQSHDDMWTHIDKDIVQRKYGGNLVNLTGGFWPPSPKLMNYTSQGAVSLISKQQYNKKFKQGKLGNRKIKQNLIEKSVVATPKKNGFQQITNMLNRDEHKQKEQIDSNIGIIKSPRTSQNRQNGINTINRVKQQVIIPIRKRDFPLFFEDQRFKSIITAK